MAERIPRSGTSRGKAAQAQARAFGTRHLHGAAHGLPGNRIQLAPRGSENSSLVARCRHSVRHAQVHQIIIRMTRARLIGAGQRRPEYVLQPPGEPANSILCKLSHRPTSVLGCGSEGKGRRGAFRLANSAQRSAESELLLLGRSPHVLASKLYASRKTSYCASRRPGRVRNELHGHPLER